MLLKNDGVLPLSKGLKSIAVIGPNADELMTLLGNYYGTPSQPGDGARRHPPGRRAGHGRAVRARRRPGRGPQDPRAIAAVDSSYLRPSAGSTEHGLKAEYFRGRELAGRAGLLARGPDGRFPLVSQIADGDLVARGELTADHALDNDDFSIALDGSDCPAGRRARYTVTVAARRRVPAVRRRHAGPRRLDDDAEGAGEDGGGDARGREGRTTCGSNTSRRERDAEVRLNWKPPGAKPPLEEALDAAQASDVVALLRRAERRGRRRGDAGLVSRLRRRRSHRHRAARDAGAAARGARRRRASRSCSC